MKTLQDVLKPFDKDKCPKCGRILDEVDASWNSSCTDAGTDYSVLNVVSECCYVEVVHIHSWYPSIDSYEEFLQVLSDDYEGD